MKIITDLDILSVRCNDVPWDMSQKSMPVGWTRLLTYLKSHKETAVGISAIQLGIDLRMCCFWNKNVIETLINPYVIEWSAKINLREEYCLSLPNKGYTVERSDWIVVRDDTHMKPQKYEGWMARVVQHEIDHLNGITIKDREIK